MTERVLVIDPGERIGWCHAVLDREASPGVLVTGHGITPAWDFLKKLGEVIGNYDTVVYETYRIYAHLAKQHIGSDVPTAQVVGVIRYLAMLNPQVKLVSQGASVQKNGLKVAPPQIQEILERLPKAHDEAHDGSALAHLSHYWWTHYVG